VLAIKRLFKENIACIGGDVTMLPLPVVYSQLSTAKSVPLA